MDQATPQLFAFLFLFSLPTSAVPWILSAYSLRWLCESDRQPYWVRRVHRTLPITDTPNEMLFGVFLIGTIVLFNVVPAALLMSPVVILDAVYWLLHGAFLVFLWRVIREARRGDVE